MEYWERFKVGVFGSASGSEINKLKPKARITGREIAKAGGILITGGCTGLPYEAALGAQEVGGIIIGISPAMDPQQHINSFGFPIEPHIFIYTGIEKKGRNVISLRTCDAAIFIAGRNGTMNEFTNFYDEGGEDSVIGLLRKTGGVVDNIIPSYIDFLRKEKPTKVTIVQEHIPERLVQKVFERLESLRS